MTDPQAGRRAQQQDHVPIRDAATVVLVRDGARGIETFLLYRVTQMEFAGGAAVFPGGGVDPGDYEIDADRIVGPGLDWWAERFAVTPHLAAALLAAAVRETWEEVGVTFLERRDNRNGTAIPVDELIAGRTQLLSKTATLPELLRSGNYVLRSDLLTPLAQRTTPVGPPRRYDTKFFGARVPAGQDPDGETTEARASGWSAARDVLNDPAPDYFLLPPTHAHLALMAEFDTVDDFLAGPFITDRDIAHH